MSQFEQIEVKFKRYVMMQTIDQDVMFDVDPSVHESFWGDMVFRLKASILSDDLPPETVEERRFVRYEVPASTWQAFKKRHAGSWYLKALVARRPVRYEPDPDHRGEYAVCKFNLERYRVYPESRLRASDHGRMVRLHDYRADWWRE